MANDQDSFFRKPQVVVGAVALAGLLVLVVYGSDFAT